MSVYSLFLAWSEGKRFDKPVIFYRPVAYSAYSTASCKGSTVHTANYYRTFLTSWKHFKGLIVPIVNAASMDLSNNKPQNESETVGQSSKTPHEYKMNPMDGDSDVNLLGIEPLVVVTDEEIQTFISKETGRDRLRSMFSQRPGNELSSELDFVKQITTNCSFMFFLLTSVVGGWRARDRYIEKNKSTKYETKFLAFRSYNDAIMFGGLRVGLTWAFKSAIFAGSFMLISQSIASYRNKTSVVEYTVAGAVTCAILRANVGLRGMVAGGIIGSVLGLTSGAIFSILLYSVHETQQDRHRREICDILTEKREIGLLIKSDHHSDAVPSDFSAVSVPHTVTTTQLAASAS